VTTVLTQALDSTGYVFAQSNVDGSANPNRHIALYSNAKGLTFYYTYKTGQRSLRMSSARFDAAKINDGRKHRIALGVSSKARAYLTVDGGAATEVALRGQPVDCRSTTQENTCIFAFGQRRGASGTAIAYPFRGTVEQLVLFPNKVFRAYPSAVDNTAGAPTTTATDWLTNANNDGAVAEKLPGTVLVFVAGITFSRTLFCFIPVWLEASMDTAGLDNNAFSDRCPPSYQSLLDVLTLKVCISLMDRMGSGFTPQVDSQEAMVLRSRLPFAFLKSKVPTGTCLLKVQYRAAYRRDIWRFTVRQRLGSNSTTLITARQFLQPKQSFSASI
jgi:hypothetical protein